MAAAICLAAVCSEVLRKCVVYMGLQQIIAQLHPLLGQTASKQSVYELAHEHMHPSQKDTSKGQRPSH